MAPVTLSPHDPNTVYLGYQFVYRSTNRGDAWERIIPDLSSNNPTEMLLKSSSAIPYQTITALAESTRVKGLIYAGTDDGGLHVTRDAGKQWTDLTAGVSTPGWYSCVCPSDTPTGQSTSRNEAEKTTTSASTSTSPLTSANVHEPRVQPAGRSRQRHSRGSGGPEHAVCRNRFRRLRLDRRRQAMEGPRRQFSVHPGLRPSVPESRQRHRNFNVRARESAIDAQRLKGQ